MTKPQQKAKATARAKKTGKADNTEVAPEPASPRPAEAGNGPGASARELYADVTVLNATAHGDLKLRKGGDLSFASRRNSVILAASEFPQAASHFPVVFSERDGTWDAFGVLGPKDGVNSFVDDEGAWTDGAYVPAFLRRYPFILVEDRQQQKLSLAADMSSDLLSRDEGAAIYQDGKVSDVGRKAMAFCVSFHRQLGETRTLIKRIADSGILVSKAAEVTFPDGTRSKLVGFHVVDEKALRELSDEEFVRLRKDGVLNLIYCHLWSMRNWSNILS